MKKILIATSLCATMSASAATTATTYGFVKAGYVMADKASVSSGTTSSGIHKAFYALDGENTGDLAEEARSTFTTTNSRWGVNAANGSKTTAKLEFDLDASHVNGVTGSGDTVQIRTRQAHINYKASENGTVTIGKKWTKFTGVNPFTYAHTRVSFWAGNNGFITDGFDYTHMFGNTAVALELSNSSASDTGYVSGPVKTLNVDHKMGDHKIGLAHTMADLKHKTISDSNKDSTASGTKLYWAGKYGNHAVNFQYTTGSNLGSIHTGGLATAVNGDDEDYKETGILLSAKHSMDSWSAFWSYGVSELAEAEEAGDNGVAKNTLISLGADTQLDAGLVGYFEHQMFTTAYYRAADDETEDSNGSTTEIGLKYAF